MSKMDVAPHIPHGLASGSRACRNISLTEMDGPALNLSYKLWSELRRDHRYPSRRQVIPRDIKPILRNTALIKVLDGGADYECRVVGDAYVMAHGQSFQGKRFSEIATLAPGLQAFLTPIYDRVVRTGEPLAMRGWVERSGSRGSLIFTEFLCLPLGEPDGGVDHILVVAVYGRSDGAAVAASSATSFSV